MATTNLCESVFLCLDQTNSRLKEYYLSTVVSLIRRKKLMAPAVTRIRLLLLTYVPADRLYERQLSYAPRPALPTDWFRQAFPEGDVEHEMSMMELVLISVVYLVYSFLSLLPFRSTLHVSQRPYSQSRPPSSASLLRDRRCHSLLLRC